MKNWFEYKLKELDKIEGYSKPGKYNGIRLDSNENIVLQKGIIKEIAARAANNIDLRKYPLQQTDKFYTQLSKYTRVHKKYLSIGNGSDQIIDLILSIFGKGNRVTTFYPTFSYFIDRCQLYSMKIDKIPLNQKDNSIDKKKILESARKSEIVYFCSPNNPTGNQMDKKLLTEIINYLRNKLIIIDEAYVEFANYSIASEILKHENIILLRTLSKAFGLAGARLGYSISSEKFANLFNSVIQYPYPINNLSLYIGSELLKKVEYIEYIVKEIKKERERMFNYLYTMDKDIRVFKSDANFIFIQILDMKKYDNILTYLKKDGIAVKIFGKIAYRDGAHIRVTIGTKVMNNRFIKSMKNACYV